MEAVLSTTKVIIFLLAVSFKGFSSCNRFMASIPKGVAALPRPSKLADTFMEMARAAGPSFLRPGKRKPNTGDSSRLIPPVTPAPSAIRMMPPQTIMTAARVSAISTAAVPPL